MKLMKETEAVCIRVSSNDFLKGWLGLFGCAVHDKKKRFTQPAARRGT